MIFFLTQLGVIVNKKKSKSKFKSKRIKNVDVVSNQTHLFHIILLLANQINLFPFLDHHVLNFLMNWPCARSQWLELFSFSKKNLNHLPATKFNLVPYNFSKYNN